MIMPRNGLQVVAVGVMPPAVASFAGSSVKYRLLQAGEFQGG